MSKHKKRIESRQLVLEFDRKIDRYVELKQEILSGGEGQQKRIESYEEICVEIAAAVKRAIRQSGLSREQAVDRINEFFGWDGKGGKSLSIHMLNHYLSKPAQYPMPSFCIWAIQRITQSLEPVRAFAEAEGARVISGDEVRQMTLGKLDETIVEMQRLKKELRSKR